jgi:nicotinate-nucleotide--dimethylbenzimidazole phosphoribosyltransferase
MTDRGSFADLTAAITRADQDARDAARHRLPSLVVPPGSLGRLEDLGVWLAGVQGTSPPHPLGRVRVVVFAGDHGVAQTGVSAYPPEVTAQMVRAMLAGRAAVNVLADLAGATVRVADLAVDADLTDLPGDISRHKVRRSSGHIAAEDALTDDEAVAALWAGVAIADEEIDAGADLLVTGDMGIGNTTPAAVLVGLLTRKDPSLVTGRGTGIDDATWMRKCAAVRDAMRRGRPVLGDQVRLLGVVGGADLAATTGFLLRAAARRTPVVLDGVVSAACALVAQRAAFRAVDWWLAGHRSTEPAHALALDRLGLDPVLDLGLGLGEGAGALLAVPLLRAAGAALADLATFEEAEVSNRE